MKAITTAPNGTAVLTYDKPLPQLGAQSLLIKVHAIALNPTDYNHVHGLARLGSTVGCDFAGEVIEVGSEVSQSFSKGERVYGFVNGASSELESGAFA